MGAKKSWLDVLKETIEEVPRTPREDLKKPTPTKVQNMRKPSGDNGAVDLDAARVSRSEDERRLLAVGWSPKDRCGPLGLTIWSDPETGFYCSQEIALHRIRDLTGDKHRKKGDL